MPHPRTMILGMTLLTLAGLTGCASPGLNEGRELISSGQTEAGIARLRSGLAEEPDNIELRAYYHTQRERYSSQMLRQAQQAIDQARFDEAETTLRKVIAMHDENPRAQQLLDNLNSSRAQHQLLTEARAALTANQPGLAAEKARLVLAQAPGQPAALDVLRQVQALQLRDEVVPQSLGAATRKPVTLEFRDAPLRNVFDMISRQSKINFVFDKDVRLDTKVTLFSRDTPIADAIDMLLSTGQLSSKVVNASTLLIYPDQPQKQKQYQELVVKSFYLGNADAKTTMAMLRTVVKAKNLYVDDRLNLLVMRDTPEAIRLAEKIIAVQDLAEPEVMLEVEVLEIQRGRLHELGIQYPNQFSLLNLPPPNIVSETPGGVVTTTTPTAPVLTIESLRDIARSDIAISPTPALNFRSEDGNVNLLANPRIRVKNREKAKIHIGDKVPVITSNTTSTGVVSESVSYLDVGLKLDVEPSVLMRDDVQIKVGLEVSNIVREIRSNNGTLTYQIGTRNAGTTLRLKDGETQVLAGLISDEDRSTASRIPGLGDLPLLGRLFSSQRDQRRKSEIVLLITPRVLRNTAAQQPALTEFRSGTENTLGAGGGAASTTPIFSSPEQAPVNVPDEAPDVTDALPGIPPPPFVPGANVPGANVPEANVPQGTTNPDTPMSDEELNKLNSVSPVFPSTQ